jgi:hypothetical protein
VVFHLHSNSCWIRFEPTARFTKKELALTSPCAMVIEHSAGENSICQKLRLLLWPIEEQ